ncbi:hypothetical protein GJ496_011275, partial [Pomphorhynchus laevis]
TQQLSTTAVLCPTPKYSTPNSQLQLTYRESTYLYKQPSNLSSTTIYGSYYTTQPTMQHLFITYDALSTPYKSSTLSNNSAILQHTTGFNPPPSQSSNTPPQTIKIAPKGPEVFLQREIIHPRHQDTSEIILLCRSYRVETACTKSIFSEDKVEILEYAVEGIHPCHQTEVKKIRFYDRDISDDDGNEYYYREGCLIRICEKDSIPLLYGGVVIVKEDVIYWQWSYCSDPAITLHGHSVREESKSLEDSLFLTNCLIHRRILMIRPKTEVQQSLGWVVHPAHLGWGPIFRFTENGSIFRAFGMYESAHILTTSISIIGFQSEICEGVHRLYFLDLCTGEISTSYSELLNKNPSESMEVCTINGIIFRKSKSRIQIPLSESTFLHQGRLYTDVINALHQETDRVPQWQVWIRRLEAKDWTPNDIADLNQMRPMWVDHLELRPASMITYCWRHNVQIAYGFRLAPGDVNQSVIDFLNMCLTNNELFNAALTNQFRHNNYQPPQSYAPPQNTQLPIPNFNSPTENLPICINNPQIFPPQQFTVPIIQPNQQCNTYSLPMMPFPPLINPLLSQTIPPFYNILQDSIHLPHNHQTLRRSVNSNG